MVTKIHDPFSFTLGDTWEIQLSCHDADGAALDLSSAEIEWRLDNVDANGSPFETVALKTAGAGISVIDAINGLCLVTLEPEETIALPAGYYLDQWRVVTADGRKSTQARGRIDAVAPLPETVVPSGMS